MFHILPTEIICSQCKSTEIVAPCNEDKVDFRCLECGHEKKRPKQTELLHYYWDTQDVKEVIEI